MDFDRVNGFGGPTPHSWRILVFTWDLLQKFFSYFKAFLKSPADICIYLSNWDLLQNSLKSAICIRYQAFATAWNLLSNHLGICNLLQIPSSRSVLISGSDCAEICYLVQISSSGSVLGSGFKALGNLLSEKTPSGIWDLLRWLGICQEAIITHCTFVDEVIWIQSSVSPVPIA